MGWFSKGKNKQEELPVLENIVEEVPEVNMVRADLFDSVLDPEETEMLCDTPQSPEYEELFKLRLDVDFYDNWYLAETEFVRHEDKAERAEELLTGILGDEGYDLYIFDQYIGINDPAKVMKILVGFMCINISILNKKELNIVMANLPDSMWVQDYGVNVKALKVDNRKALEEEEEGEDEDATEDEF